MENQRMTLKPYGNMLEIQNYGMAGTQGMIKSALVSIKDDLSEIQKKNPLIVSKGGIPLLYDKGEETVYVDASDSHSLIIGSTGSKKTRLVVLPLIHILCHAGESMIVSDPKAEIYNRTAAKLKGNGYNIMVLNFRDPSLGDGWNPLAIPYEMFRGEERDRAYEFINDIATNLMCSELNHQDVFWDYSASDLLFGLILLAFRLNKKNKVSFEDILDLRAGMFPNGCPNLELWEEAKKDALTHHSLIGTVEAPDRTRTSILSSFDQKMRIFAFQENLTEMLKQNTVSLDKLGTEKSAIFLIMPDEKTTYHRLITLFVKQCYERLIYLAQNQGLSTFKTRINYVLDEFSTLPTISDFPAMITAARSRNIRFFLFIQSQKQLEHRYKVEAETIESNCNNWIFLTSRELNLLRSISALAGQTAEKEPLISVFALQHLNKEKGEALVFSGRLFPFITELADISEFDHDRYEILEMSRRVPAGDEIPEPDTCSIADGDKDEGKHDKYIQEDDDLQKELERKFDELFGSIDNEDESWGNEERGIEPIEATGLKRSVHEDIASNGEGDLGKTDCEGIDDMIILHDDNENEVKFEFLDLIEYQNEEYVVLLPTDKTQEDDGEVVILHLEDSDGDEESYGAVNDEETLNTIFRIFKDKFKDVFDFTK